MHQPVRSSLLDEPQLQEDTLAALREADSALERGDLAEAGTHYMAIARRTPENGDAWLGVSRVLVMGGEFERAADLLDRAIAQQHKSRAWLVLAHVLITKAEFDRALQFIGRSIALQPKDPQAFSLQAMVFHATGECEAELNALQRAARYMPTDPELWERLITALETLSGPEAAIDYLENNRDAVPQDVAVDLRKARLCASAGQFRKLDLILRRVHSALKADLDNIDHHLALARCLTETGHEPLTVDMQKTCSMLSGKEQ